LTGVVCVVAFRVKIITKHLNTLCGQDEELTFIKVGGIYNYHRALKRNTFTQHQYSYFIENFEIENPIKYFFITVIVSKTPYQIK
jgi:hypothetical protein